MDVGHQLRREAHVGEQDGGSTLTADARARWTKRRASMQAFIEEDANRPPIDLRQARRPDHECGVVMQHSASCALGAAMQHNNAQWWARNRCSSEWTATAVGSSGAARRP